MRREVVIRAEPGDVWRVVGRPDVLHHWFPGIVGCVVDGGSRTVTLATGLVLSEELLTCDPLQRRFQYRVCGPPFAEHLGTIDVVALPGGSSLVMYASDAAPAALAVVLGGATGAALAELRRQFEAGGGPAVEAVAGIPARPTYPEGR